MVAVVVTTGPAPPPRVRMCVLGALGRGALCPRLPAPTWPQAPGVPAASDPHFPARQVPCTPRMLS